MGNPIQLIKSSSIYILLGFLPLGVNFLLAPVYTFYLPPEEYAIVGLANLAKVFLTIFIGLGLDSGFSRFYFQYYKRSQLVHALLSTIIVTILLIGAVIGIFLYFFGDFIFSLAFKNEAFTFSKYGLLVFITTIVAIVHTMFLIYYRNQENIKAYAVVSLSFFFLSVTGILLGIIYFEAGALGSIAGRMIGSTFLVIILCSIYFTNKKVYVKLKYLKPILKYCLPIIPYLILLAGFNALDRIMVERFFSLAELGKYNFAFMLSSTTSVLLYSIFNALSPRIYKLLTEDADKHGKQVRKINTVFLLVVVAYISIAIALVIPILNIFVDDSYFEISNYISILFIIYIPQIYYVIFTIPIFFYKRTKILPTISLIAISFGIASNLYFIPILGIYGVCLSVFITKFAQFGAAYYFISKYGYSKKEYMQLGKSVLLSATVLIVFMAIFVYNFFCNNLSSYLVNAVPLIILIISIPLFFKGEITRIKALLKAD